MSIGKNIKKSKEQESQMVDAAKLQEINESVAAVSVKEQKPSKISSVNLLENTVKDDEKSMLIVFPVGDEEYAISIDDVKEVVPTPPIALVPQVPKHVRGLTNVRGNVHTVIDLRGMFSKSDDDKEMSKPGKFVLVIKSEELQLAINVNSVPDTMIISNKEVDSPSNIITHKSQKSEHVRGIINLEKRMIIWIDVLELIASTAMVN